MKLFTNLGTKLNGAARRKSDLDFGFGYSSPGERRWTSTVPKNQEVWAYALEKTYTKLKGDRRLTTLMGIVYRRNEPETIEAFETLLSEHLSSFQLSEGFSGIAEEFSPWPVIGAMRKIESESPKPRTAIYYVKFGDRWKVEGLSGGNPINPKRRSDGDYYSLNSPRGGPEIYGNIHSLEYLKFLSMGTKGQQDRTLSSICRKARIFVPEVIHEGDAATFLSRLESSKPHAFAHNTKTANITFEKYEFSNVREAEEYVSFALVIENVQHEPPASSHSDIGPG